MPGPKRHRRERTDEWASIKQWTLWPEQELYEQIRPLVLFHETAGERAKEIDVPQHLSLQNDSRHDTVGAMGTLGCFVVQLFDHAMSSEDGARKRLPQALPRHTGRGV